MAPRTRSQAAQAGPGSQATAASSTTTTKTTSTRSRVNKARVAKKTSSKQTTRDRAVGRSDGRAGPTVADAAAAVAAATADEQATTTTSAPRPSNNAADGAGRHQQVLIADGTLAYVSAKVPITSGANTNSCKDSTMTGELRVMLDKEHPSRLAYNADFFLNGNEQRAATDRVAYITSWRIDRQTADKPFAQGRWVDDLLAPRLRDLEGSVASHEAALCLKAVFTRKGALKAAVKGNRVRQQLEHKGLMFIQMVHVIKEHQGQGLLRPMLALYRQLLSSLPEWFAFEDTLVLVPARPADEIGEVWAEMEDEAVEVALEGIYARTDDYLTCVKDVVVEGLAVTVMCRSTKNERIES